MSAMITHVDMLKIKTLKLSEPIFYEKIERIVEKYFACLKNLQKIYP